MLFHFHHVILVILLLVIPVFDAQSWRTLASLPSVRTELSAVVLDGLIYALGGKSKDKILSTVDVYKPKTNTWSKSIHMLKPRFGFAATYARTAAHPTVNRLYVFGGSLDVSSYTDHVEMFIPDSTNPGLGKWVRAPSLPMKLAAASAVSVPYHPIGTDPTPGIVIVGGWTEPNRASKNVFFFNGFNYTQLPEMLFGRAQAGLAFIQLPDSSWLYSIDGGADMAPAMNTVERMQFGKSGTWDVAWDTPYARNLVAATTHKKQIYVIGGHTPEQSQLATIGCLNTSAYDMGWAEFKPSLPKALQGSAAIVIDNTMYVIGGETDYRTPCAINIALDL